MLNNTRSLYLDICDYNNNAICNLYDNHTNVSGQATEVFVKTERNGWKELSFKIPSVCMTEEGEEENFRLQYLIADYRIRLTTDAETDYYIISEPRISHTSFSKNVEVIAGHISQLLKTKNLNLEFSDEEGNNVGTAESLLRTILDGTSWSVGEVADFLEDDGTVKVRSIVASAKTGAFALISTLCDKFEAKPIYHGDTRKVDLVPLNPFSDVEGSEIPQEVLDGKAVIELNYGKNVSNIVRTLNTENLVTRLYAYGSYGDKVKGLCSLQNVKHTEYGVIVQANYAAETEFKFTDKNSSAHYFSIPSQINSGDKLIWSDMDPVSMSYVWNNAQNQAYKVYKEPKSNNFTTLVMASDVVSNKFDYLMDFDYYNKIGLLTDEMFLSLAQFQRNMPAVVDASTEASSALINKQLELSRIAESNTGFLRLDVASYSRGPEGELVLNLRKTIYPDAVMYRSDYNEARRNYFSWYYAESLKENGDPTSGIGSVVYIIHETNPVTWNKAYVKYIDGEQTTQDYSVYDATDPNSVTLWTTQDKVGALRPTDRIYLFSTNSISGRMGVRESEIESIQQTLDQATKVVTEKHPTYFVWDNAIAPSLDVVREGYGWCYRTYSNTTNPGELYFCYGLAGDVSWKRAIVSETDPSVISGGYYFNLKSKKLFHGENSKWVNIADSDIIITSSASPYRAPNAEAKRLSQSFSKVAYYCLRYDMLYKGIFDKYIYTTTGTLAPGNYAFKNEFGFYWVFTTDLTLNRNKQLYIDTIKYLVYQNEQTEDVVTPEAKPYEAIDFPVQNELAETTLLAGSIDRATGVETNASSIYRTNHITVYGGVNYTYSLPQSSFIVYYDSNRRYIDYLNLSTTGTFTTPVRAKYARIVVSTNSINSYYVQVQDYTHKLFIKEKEYTILEPLTTEGTRTGMNALVKTFADTADSCYLTYLPAFKTAQTQIKEADDALKNTLQDLYREGYWQKNEYVEGDENNLYKDTLKNIKKISKPETIYDLQYLDLYSANQGMGYSITEELDDVPWPDIDMSDAVHLIDEEIDVNCWAFIDKLEKCYDQPWKTRLTINTDLSIIAQHSFTDALARIAEVTNETNAKQTIYKRAAAISGSGAYAADKLEGTIKANRLLFDGGTSNWHTDEKGNLVFESSDGQSAMMITGYGYCIANTKNANGEWEFRSFGTGAGISADEIVTGEMSAVHLISGTVTTDKLSASVGQELEIGSNKALMLYSTVDGYRPAGGLLTQVSNGDGTYRPVSPGDSYIQIAAKEGNTPAYINVVTGGALNLQGAVMNLTSQSTMNLTSGDLNIDASGRIQMLAGSSMGVGSGASVTIASGGSMTLASGADMYILSGSNMYVRSGGSVSIQSGSTFTVDSNNFSIDSNGNVMLRGTVYAWAGNIAGFTIGGDSSGSGWSRQYIYTGNKTSVSSNSSGLYIGTDGININNRLKYDFSKLTIEAESLIIGKQSSGSGSLISMNAQNGEINLLSSSSINIASGKTVTISSTGSILIGNSGSPFTISSDGSNAYIRNGMTSLSDTSNNGVYLGTNGIALGKGLFKVTSSGALTATSADIKGTITATGGRIGASSNGTGGWIISNGMIYADNGDVALSSSGSFRFYAGNSTASDAAFYVKDDGTIYSSKGKIGGWAISKYSLMNSSGSVGMYNRYGDSSSSEISFWAGNETPSSAPFYVTTAGYLHASDVSVEGTIKATALYIGGTQASVQLDGSGKITMASLTQDVQNDISKAASISIDSTSGKILLSSLEWDSTGLSSSYIDLYPGAIDINSGGEINIYSNGELNIRSNGELNINSNGELNVNSNGELNINSGGELNIGSNGDLNIGSGGSLTIGASGSLTIGSSSTFEVHSSNFDIDSNGNVTLTGTINAETGRIGSVYNEFQDEWSDGWVISHDRIYSAKTEGYMELNTNNDKSWNRSTGTYEFDDPYAFWVGSSDAEGSLFKIKKDGTVSLNGEIYAQKGEIAGWKLEKRSIYGESEDKKPVFCNGSDNTFVAIASDIENKAETPFIWAGKEIPAWNKFQRADVYITRDGTIQCRDLDIYDKNDETIYTRITPGYVSTESLTVNKEFSLSADAINSLKGWLGI